MPDGRRFDRECWMGIGVAKGRSRSRSPRGGADHLKLNVGDTYFETTWQTLLNEPDSNHIKSDQIIPAEVPQPFVKRSCLNPSISVLKPIKNLSNLYENCLVYTSAAAAE